jgi:quercetin dioxygenase-like cupin family protein
MHTGHELVYCLDGQLEYTVEEQKYQLKAGDSLLLEAHQPHRWHNLGPGAAVFLLVFEAAGQGASVEEHLRREAV